MVSSVNTPEQPLHGFPLCTVQILLRVIATKPPEFLQMSVQHLFLDEKTTLQELKTRCYQTDRLTNWHALRGLQRLRRLALSVKELLKLHATDARSVLDHITHLQVFVDCGDHPQWHACIPAMSSLTHIAPPFRKDPQLRTTLRECTNIRCIVLLATDARTSQLKNNLVRVALRARLRLKTKCERFQNFPVPSGCLHSHLLRPIVLPSANTMVNAGADGIDVASGSKALDVEQDPRSKDSVQPGRNWSQHGGGVNG
ncbi:hypothetical protein K438DRAFT_1771555 [Mycena galopus ATCC 62051]|nr:hypothetical protein K438DRAFT_1771555 [Mycena galopus ATCC 62051]